MSENSTHVLQQMAREDTVTDTPAAPSIQAVAPAAHINFTSAEYADYLKWRAEQPAAVETALTAQSETSTIVAAHGVAGAAMSDTLVTAVVAKTRKTHQKKNRKGGSKHCKIDGCISFARSGGICQKHGAAPTKKTCSSDGCTNKVMNNKKCQRHGAVVPLCAVNECTNQARSGKTLCKRHSSEKNTQLSMPLVCSYEAAAAASLYGLIDQMEVVETVDTEEYGNTDECGHLEISGQTEQLQNEQHDSDEDSLFSSVHSEVVDEQHDDPSPSLFENDAETIRHNIPSQHICPIVRDPPFEAVHFDLPSTNGTTTAPINQQVYERSALYRFVSTRSAMSSTTTLSHPLTRVQIERNRAWNYVRPVAKDLQATLHSERLALNLPLEDDNPLNDEDYSRYEEVMRGHVDR